MTRIPDAVAVASLDTHCLIVTVPNHGPADVASSLPRHAAADVLRQIADGLAEMSTPAERAVEEARQCLAFNVDEQSPALTSLRDILLDTETRTPAAALATAYVLLAAHTRELSALARSDADEYRDEHGVNRSTRGLLTGMSHTRKLLDRHATSLDEQAPQ